MPDKPGDGKTSPFGNGQGDTQMAASGGNDFVANPKGSSGGKGGGQPASYGTSRPQQSAGKHYDRSEQDAAEGPSTAAEVATPSTGARGGLVTASAGNVAHKPFKVSGG